MSIATEKRTFEAMIEIYCRRNHGAEPLCSECRNLYDYAVARLDKCPFGENKPACKNCTVHCYSPEKREKIKDVMRFSGRRMLRKHPYLTLLHLIK
jgi:hypothetical protein